MIKNGTPHATVRKCLDNNCVSLGQFIPVVFIPVKRLGSSDVRFAQIVFTPICEAHARKFTITQYFSPRDYEVSLNKLQAVGYDVASYGDLRVSFRNMDWTPEAGMVDSGRYIDAVRHMASPQGEPVEDRQYCKHCRVVRWGQSTCTEVHRLFTCEYCTLPSVFSL